MIYKKTLPKEQQAIYPRLRFTRNDDFILFGGTALSLQIGHRISVDFDFFTKNKLDSNKKKSILVQLKADKIIQDELDTLVYMKNGVKISFFGNIDFATNSNSFMIDDVLRVATTQAVFATKLKATFDRAEYKDYKDIVELLRRDEITLQNGIKKMFEFYGNDFSTSQIMKNLTYFDDGDLHRLLSEEKSFLINSVKDFLVTNTKALDQIKREMKSEDENSEEKQSQVRKMR